MFGIYSKYTKYIKYIGYRFIRYRKIYKKTIILKNSWKIGTACGRRS